MTHGTIIGHLPGKVLVDIHGMRIVIGTRCLPPGELPENYQVWQEVACEYVDVDFGALWMIREKANDATLV